MNIGSRRISLGFERFSGLYLWALFIIVFGIWTPSLFLSQATLHSVASQQAIGAILGLAVLVPLVAGAYDLSVGASVNLCAILVSLLQSSHGWSMWPAIACGVGAGVVIGAVNGFIVVKLRVNSFIATLGTTSVISAVQVMVTNNQQPFPASGRIWSDLTQLQIGGFQDVVIYLLVIAFLVWWMLEHTPVGRYLHAVGGNPEAARLSGVKVDRWTWLSLVMSGTICGIAGVLYASQSGPSLTFGSALMLPAFAAVFLGLTQIKPGRFNVWGTMLAIYALATGVKGLQLVTSDQWLNDLFNGVALIGAVSFAIWRQRRGASRRPSKPGADPAERDDHASEEPLPGALEVASSAQFEEHAR